jgi:hypothetical protein
MDDTRDIAIKAQASSSSAHLRLDGINGQISRLGDEMQQTREGLHDEIDSVHEKLNATREDVVAVKTKAGVMAAVGAFVVSALVAPVAVALTLRYATPDPAPRKTDSATSMSQNELRVAGDTSVPSAARTRGDTRR